MRNKYAQEFKNQTIRQVFDNRFAVKDVTNRLGINDQILHICNKGKKIPRPKKEIEEFKRLKKKLKQEIIIGYLAYLALNNLIFSIILRRH